jgi:hypothetical protein
MDTGQWTAGYDPNDRGVRILAKLNYSSSLCLFVAVSNLHKFARSVSVPLSLIRCFNVLFAHPHLAYAHQGTVMLTTSWDSPANSWLIKILKCC